MTICEGPGRQRCVFSGFGGKSHEYSECVKKVTEMLDGPLGGTGCEQFGWDCTAAHVAGVTNYITSLISNPSNAIASKCGHILGNKYVLETDIKCSNGKPLSKYVNNTCGGEYCGYIPATLGGATKINAMGILNSFIGDAKPKCKKVKLKCHVFHKNDNCYYNRDSGEVWIAERDLAYIDRDDILSGPTDGFSNITSSDNLNNVNMINKEGDDFDKLYYVLVTLLLLYITYKILRKK